MAEAAILGENAANNNGVENPDHRLKALYERVTGDKWFRFCREVYVFSDSEIDAFKKGVMNEEYFYKVVKERLRNDPTIVRRHRSKIKDNEIRRLVEDNEGQILPDDLQAKAIYGIFDGLSIKDRYIFCREELCATPSNFIDCPVDDELKKQMSATFWREKALCSLDAMEAACLRAEQFFRRYKGSERKPNTATKVENLILGPCNVFIDHSTRDTTG